MTVSDRCYLGHRHCVSVTDCICVWPYLISKYGYDPDCPLHPIDLNRQRLVPRRQGGRERP